MVIGDSQYEKKKHFMEKLSLIFILIFFEFNSWAQDGSYSLYKITSMHTSFPDTGRTKGHMYENVLYNFSEHYNDSSVNIIVPSSFDPGKKSTWYSGFMVGIIILILPLFTFNYYVSLKRQN